MARLLPGGGPSPAEVRKASASPRPPVKTPGYSIYGKPGYLNGLKSVPQHHFDVTPELKVGIPGIGIRLGDHGTPAHKMPTAAAVRKGLSEPTQWGGAAKKPKSKPKPRKAA